MAIVNLLLERGAGVNVPGRGGLTPLHEAAGCGQVRGTARVVVWMGGLGGGRELTCSAGGGVYSHHAWPQSYEGLVRGEAGLSCLGGGGLLVRLILGGGWRGLLVERRGGRGCCVGAGRLTFLCVSSPALALALLSRAVVTNSSRGSASGVIIEAQR